MITEDYVSFEVAKLLKEKGFDELCIFKYSSEGVRMKAGVAIDEWQNSELDDDECSCVSHQMAMKWLRDVYDIHISVNKTFLINDMDNKPYLVYVCTEKCNTSYNAWSEYHSTYEQAVEAALKYCLTELI